MKTVDAVLITERGRKPGLLSTDDSSGEVVAVLIVDGVEYGPGDLPSGAYIVVRESDVARQAAVAGFVREPPEAEVADLAAVAGFALGPPNEFKRRAYRALGKVIGAVLVASAIGSLLWAVRDLLELNLPGVLAWIGLSLFLGLLGLYWWFVGEQEQLEAEARSRVRARRRFGFLIRRR